LAGVKVFVTSDSLLNAFHVLYEESLGQLEKANSQKLRRILKFVWANLEGCDKTLKAERPLAAAAEVRARVLVATAMRLLGDEPEPIEKSIAAMVKEEAARVESATGRLKPKWLGPPDQGFMALDYTRFRPRGFYAATPALEGYFRAVSWLQAVPFRANQDEELLSILLLGNCITADRLVRDHEIARDVDAYFDCFSRLLGEPDTWGLLTAAHAVQDSSAIDGSRDGLARVQEALSDRREKAPAINDQIALVPNTPGRLPEPSFRMIPAYRTPDAVCFQRTTAAGTFRRPLPTGLEVCAALGSPFARSRLAAEEEGRLLAEIDRCKALYSRGSLYCDYMQCLSALLAKPEPEAPAFMSSEAWRVKSCQTALAGWAQLRHTWVLQAKESAVALGADFPPSGFVEPAPEFFSRMAALVAETELVLQRAGALSLDKQQMAAEIRTVTDLLEKAAAGREGVEGLRQLSRGAKAQITSVGEIIMAMADADKITEDLPKHIVAMRKLADELEQGRIPADPQVAKAIELNSQRLAGLWRSLETLCRRLESLAHKQLRGAPINDEEDRFIRYYGKKLANVMFYGNDACHLPDDDAPRISDVFTNPNTGQVLEVGVGQPRAMYVLYPFQGVEVLCLGAVMPYYEFAHATRLTDEEWMGLLDSRDRPKPPEWLTPILSPRATETP
jgi:hypothetical protein